MYSTGTSVSGTGTYVDANNILATVGNFTSLSVTDALNTTTSPPPQYLGFFVGAFPLCWNDSATPTKIDTFNYLGGSNNNGYGITYSLEYQVGSSWIPYQQNNLFGQQDAPIYNGSVAAVPTTSAHSIDPSAVTWDPRTIRWGGTNNLGPGNFVSAYSPGNNPPMTVQTIRADMTVGVNIHGWYLGCVTQDQYLQRLNLPMTNNSGYIVDTDSVLRRPMGAYVPASPTTTNGLPLAQVYTGTTISGNTSSRPIILHRPFRSVAELGYVFSDTPWRNIDFFTPESGYSALLDTFCINEDYRPDAVTAGRVDLNTKQAPVIQALLAGAYRDEENPTTAGTGQLANTEAVAISQTLVKRTSGNSTVVGGTASTGPLSNIADLVGRYTPGAVANSNNSGTYGASPAPVANSPGVPYDGFSADLGIYTGGSGTASASSLYNTVQRYRETTMRALSDAGQAGTWNLMIDVVAQSGRYPANATGLSDFLVEGERRFWVHVAIDRQTGQIIDENIEAVNE